MGDETIRDTLVDMFSDSDGNNGTKYMTRDGMKTMLMCAYHIAMDHYSEGPQMCLTINKTLIAVIDGCFHTKQQLSSQFVSHWIQANCPRLLLPLHRYSVHSLATSYRILEEEGPSLAAGNHKLNFS